MISLLGLQERVAAFGEQISHALDAEGAATRLQANARRRLADEGGGVEGSGREELHALAAALASYTAAQLQP